MKGLERSVRKGHPKGLGSSSMKSSRNTSPKVWSTGSQILSSACLQMLKSLGLEKPPWTAKQVKASICFQPWFLSWKRCLLGPKKKKRKQCYLQPRAWKSLWHCGMKQVHSSPLLNFQKAWLLEKNSCWPTNGWMHGPWKRVGILLPLLWSTIPLSTSFGIPNFWIPKGTGISKGKTLWVESPEWPTASALEFPPQGWAPNCASNTGCSTISCWPGAWRNLCGTVRRIRCILEKALLLLILEKTHSGDILEKVFTQHVLEKILHVLENAWHGCIMVEKRRKSAAAFLRKSWSSCFKILIFIFGNIDSPLDLMLQKWYFFTLKFAFEKPISQIDF